MTPNNTIFVNRGVQTALTKTGIVEAEAHTMGPAAATLAPTFARVASDRTLLTLLNVLLQTVRSLPTRLVRILKQSPCARRRGHW